MTANIGPYETLYGIKRRPLLRELDPEVELPLVAGKRPMQMATRPKSASRELEKQWNGRPHS